MASAINVERGHPGGLRKGTRFFYHEVPYESVGNPVVMSLQVMVPVVRLVNISQTITIVKGNEFRLLELKSSDFVWLMSTE